MNLRPPVGLVSCLLFTALAGCALTPDEETADGAPAAPPADAAPLPDETSAADATEQAADAGPSVTVLVSGVGPGATIALGMQGEELEVDADGVASFATRLDDGSLYEVSVLTSPPGRTCFVTSGTGRMGPSNPGSAVVDCVPGGAGRLRIEEIGPSLSPERFIELRNTGTEAADLSRYTLRTLAANPGGFATFLATFPLPARSVAPGGTIVLRGDVDGVGANEISLRTPGGTVPTWAVSGFVELLIDGRTADFVRFGTESIGPTTPRHFGGANPPAPLGDEVSLHRTFAADDTNRGDDFTLGPATPGLPDDSPAGPVHALNVLVYGLGEGQQLILANGPDTLTIDRSGQGTFPAGLATGAHFAVVIARQPSGGTCAVTGATGTVGQRAPMLVVDCLSAGSGRMRINEIGPGSIFFGSKWIELVNVGAGPADLARYRLKTRAVLPGDGFIDGTFELGHAIVPAGGLVVVRGDLGEPLAPGEVGLVLPSGHVPNWNTFGFVELLQDGGTVDFVHWGVDEHLPASDRHWLGPAAPALADGLSLARITVGQDDNTAGDFALRPPTIGYANDLVSDTDDDEDGIPDEAEQGGHTYGGLDLYAMGARAGQRDVFVELDWMKSSHPAVRPRRDALDKVRAMYAAHGVAIHFDAGDLFDAASGIDPDDYDLGGGGELPAFAGGISLLSDDPGTDRFHAIKTANLDRRRLPIFHYVLSGEPSAAAAGSAGIAELGGNDVAILLGTDPAAAVRPSVEQAIVLAHELGHNFGLQHGGADARNFKPNYLSIMNYLYRTGLPVIGAGEGEPYRVAHGCSRDEPELSLATLRLDFSDGTGADLDERAVVETRGLGRPGSHAVDFNCDGKITSAPYALDLDGDNGLAVIEDHDDWGAIEVRPTAPVNAKPGVEASFDDRAQPVTD